MIRSSAYINGLSCISPQSSVDQGLSGLVANHHDLKLLAIEPDYKAIAGKFIGRRMGKLTKMGITTAWLALQEAGIEMPDAIITGTGLGCMTETEKFILSVLENNEEMLNPTSFMQSTHNTLSGQVALMLHCKNYNFTYVQKGFSLESSLLDAMIRINHRKESNILVGGFDEMTENHFTITKRLNYWKEKAIPSAKLYEHVGPGTLAGEAAGFFVLSGEKTDQAAVELCSMKMFYKPEIGDIKARVDAFLKENLLTPEDIDLVILGKNGDEKAESYYREFEKNYPSLPQICFKHLCGENYTVSTFALWLADRIAREGRIPDVCFPKDIRTEKPSNILIYNHFRTTDHSLYLLKNCRSSV